LKEKKMSLIEIIAEYADIVVVYGRDVGRKFLQETCDVALHEHIIATVNDCGVIVTASGEQWP
jgi:transposase